MKASPKQSLVKRLLSVSILTLTVAGIISTANAQNLHNFAHGDPYASLTHSGSTLYGMTSAGGSSYAGLIFKMGIDGSSYTILHEFAMNNGLPRGSLTLSDSTLYGMKGRGGASGNGAIFKIDTNGSSYTILHEFAGGSGDGSRPEGNNLTLSGSTLYGMTYYGGAGNNGVIFKIETDGSNYTNLHEFAGGSGDGARPNGSLTLSGTTLYGMTTVGGASGRGVIFKMDTNGSNYTNFHEFTSGADDGTSPYGDVTLSGSTLYGMTHSGGASDAGVIFKIDTDGSNYTNLHNFAGGIGDGSSPYGSLILNGSALAGMTRAGGANGLGVIFKMVIDGSSYTNIHNFAGGAGDGRSPFYGALTEASGYYYGMTYSGGSSDRGMVFKYLVPEPTLFGFALIAAGLFLKVRKV